MTADSFPGSGEPITGDTLSGSAAPGGNVQAPPAPEPASPAPAVSRLGFRELSERVIASAFERYPWLNRVLMGVLTVCTGTCVVAVVARLSPLPLVPVPLFLAGGYGLWQARGARNRRQLVNWVVLAGLAGIVGFWLIAVVGRWVE